ncbi:MAG: sulfatase-like hydrolase/transferase, partial [Acidimicrobiales bacterium]|nr:sulfatase-like hydrolase/transferase [Acidimicrobiales bacterium]
AAAAAAAANGEVTEIPESQALDGFFASSLATQPKRLTAFLDALRPTDDPFFAFLHLVLPHQPWFSREDGTRYRTPGEYEGPDVDTPWRARVTRQRHLLQASYADRLVGAVLDRLRASGEYEDTLVVVVSDHGASFVPGESIRSLDDDNLDEIAYAPLLIKAPGQAQGAVDEANLLSVDVVPTVADLLGTEPGWEVDGVSARDRDAIAARRGRKYVYSYTDAFSYEFLGIERFDDDDTWAAVLAGRFPPAGPGGGAGALAGLYARRPGAALIGRTADDVFGPGDTDALVRELDELESPTTDELLAEVIGVVPAAPDGTEVLVAVNGTIVGTSPLFDDARARRQFVVLLPDDALRPTRNEIRIALLDPGSGAVTELDLAGTD